MTKKRSVSGIYGGLSAEQRRTVRRAALMQAGSEIWRADGWAAVTMRAVCARAGLTDRYFYESFADRDALLVAIWDERRDELLAMLLGAITDKLDLHPLVQLQAGIEALVRHVSGDPQAAGMVFSDHAGSAALAARRSVVVQEATAMLVELSHPFLREDVDPNAFRMAVLVGIGGAVELTMSWMSGALQAEPDEVIENLTGLGVVLARQFLREDLLAAFPDPAPAT